MKPPRVDPFLEAKKKLLRKPLKKPKQQPIAVDRKAPIPKRLPKKKAPPQPPAHDAPPPPQQTARPPRPQTADTQGTQDTEDEADLLIQLENALVKMASKISHIESKLEEQEGHPAAP